MKFQRSVSLLLLFIAGVLSAQAQNSFFQFASLDEGMAAAKEQDKLVIVYFFQDENGSADAYNHIWSDPLVTRFVDKLAIPVVIDAESESGEAFVNRKRKRKRRKSNTSEPGIYFFSETGRTLGVLRGALEGQEGIGQVMLMLGAAEYARHENQDHRGRRRFMRYR